MRHSVMPQNVGHRIWKRAEGAERSALFAIHQPHLETYGGLNGFTEKVAGSVSFAYRLVNHPF